MQQPVATHTNVEAVAAPTQQQGAIGSNLKPTLPDRNQPPATLRPDRRLPARDQPFSGDSMPTPVSPDALRYVLAGYNHNIVTYLLNGFKHGFGNGWFGLPAQQDKGVTNLKYAVELSDVIDSKIAKQLALGRILDPSDAPPPVTTISAIQYATIQDDIRFIKQTPGNQVFMAEVDI